MKFLDFYLDALRNWKDFDGKTDRRSYWMFVLVNMAITFGVGILSSIITPNSGGLSSLYSIILLIPGIAIATRRLHDIGKSGWWQLIVFIPVIGWIWLIVLFAKESE
jgi:uncharacterized membrane protein YhaH (DUF805 family)